MKNLWNQLRENKENFQLKQVKLKLRRLEERFPELIKLDPPVSEQWLSNYEAARMIRFPEDFRAVVTQIADGGFLPAFLYGRYWRSLHIHGNQSKQIQNPFPFTDKGKLCISVDNPVNLPGQYWLMGNKELGWALIVNGSFKGEVWTYGDFGAVRVPGCTFSQWMELVLDGNLGAYIMFCLTGKEEGETSAWKRFFDLLRTSSVWMEKENPEKKCARWLDRHRKPIPKPKEKSEDPDQAFYYSGPSHDGGTYLKNRLSMVLLTLPEESTPALYALNEAQSSSFRHLGKSHTGNTKFCSSEDIKREFNEDWINWQNQDEITRLSKIIQTIQNKGIPDSPSFSNLKEQLLFEQAVKLSTEKKFEQYSSGIQDLSFLQGLTHLKQITLRNNEVADLSPLSELINLTSLDISYNLVWDLLPLAQMSKLSVLSAQGNQISSLEPLRELYGLTRINLRGNPLKAKTLTCLRKCKRLEMIDLSNTGLRDLGELESCRAWNLDLYGNPDLTGLEALASMKNIACLYLDTAVARNYDIPAIAPQFTEYARMGGISLYIWPEEYYG